MFARILVTLDGSKLSERAVPHALQMARAFQSQVILLEVLEPEQVNEESGLIDPLSWQIQKAEAELYLQTQRNVVREQYSQIEHQILEGKTPEAILQFAQNSNIDLLVMSSHGRGGLSRWNVSSVIHKVVSKAYLPVLVVRAYQPTQEELAAPTYKKILLPIDCSKRAECAIPATIAIAEANNAEIILMNVLKTPEVPFTVKDAQEMNRVVDELMTLSRGAVEDYMAELSNRIPVKNEVRIIESNSAPQAIHELADQEDVDLLVFCAHGQTGHVKWPFGSVSNNYLEHGNRSVLVIQDFPQSLVQPTAAEIAAAESGSRG